MANHLYYAKVKWYNDYTDKETTNCLVVVASNYSEAIAKIETDLTYIDNIEIEELTSNSSGIIYVDDSKATYDMIREENDY